MFIYTVTPKGNYLVSSLLSAQVHGTVGGKKTVQTDNRKQQCYCRIEKSSFPCFNKILSIVKLLIWNPRSDMIIKDIIKAYLAIQDRLESSQ